MTKTFTPAFDCLRKDLACPIPPPPTPTPPGIDCPNNQLDRATSSCYRDCSVDGGHIAAGDPCCKGLTEDTCGPDIVVLECSPNGQNNETVINANKCEDCQATDDENKACCAENISTDLYFSSTCGRAGPF